MAVETWPSMAQVLDTILTAAADTAPVSLTIGGITPSGTVTHNEIVITEAPPAVVQVLVTTYRFVGLSPRGLRIPTRDIRAKIGE